MKLIEICQHCDGKGKTSYLQFFSRPCTHCSGQGKTTKSITDMKKGVRTFI
ncbi:hypothetical protein [Bacillus sp. CECT 9360]|uniref:hypothetical protein n=1 Tax=Bacillus sp. CECT 9360 TaxID=2845821 RepID=UPI001E38A697|nr:hypothetical protein [Bacillus sp. CECT 9360]CAH0344301.1 hypothetical protein BCI9360_00548 [Bacillus sp. CECT 9360]